MAAATVPAKTSELDMDRLSRVIAALGLETVGKLANMDILIVGMRGLGIEIAKNTVLGNFRSVTVYDPEPVTIADTGVNFYLPASSIGQPRDTTCVKYLADLNPSMKVSVLHPPPSSASTTTTTPSLANSSIPLSMLRDFSCVVATGVPNSVLQAWDQFCRSSTPAIPFIAADVFGVTARMFVDFGESHIIRDVDGEPGNVCPIIKIERVVAASGGAADNAGAGAGGSTNAKKRLVIHTMCTNEDGTPAAPHEYGEGQYVTFRQVGGMVQLNRGDNNSPTGDASTATSLKPFKVLNPWPYTFEIEIDGDISNGVDGDASTSPDHTEGGIFEKFNMPKLWKHTSFESRISTPLLPEDEAFCGMMPSADMGKLGRSEQLHIAYQGLDMYRVRHSGELPPLHDQAAVSEVLGCAKEFAASVRGKDGTIQMDEADISERVVKNLVTYARSELPPLCAIFGGIVAQEIVKVTGRYTPFTQFLYMDAFEILPTPPIAAAVETPVGAGSNSDSSGDATAEAASAGAGGGGGASSSSSVVPHPFAADEFTPRGDRYDNMTTIVGRTVMDALKNQRVFMVGSGAIGCETLKNFALLGVGCGPSGRVSITDMDTIEVSNLSRQFLFRSNDCKKPKSTTAANAAMCMNPDMKIEAFTDAARPETEKTVFTDKFWNDITLVVNALDNHQARLYVDSRCVWFGLPLLESGTQGTKAYTQMILPHKSISYSDIIDPPNRKVPICTINSFPYLTQHTVEWALHQFRTRFESDLSNIATFCKDPHSWLATTLESSQTLITETIGYLVGVANALEHLLPALTPETCVSIGLFLFQQYHDAGIKQLLAMFPADAMDPKTGNKFWSPPKRVPYPVEFDAANDEHVQFVSYAAALYAVSFKIAPPAQGGWDSVEAVRSLITTVLSSSSSSSSAMALTDSEFEDTTVRLEKAKTRVQTLLSKYSVGTFASLSVVPHEFEKDDDANHHIDMIAAIAKFRARNYGIDEMSRFKAKVTAGNIIPALATTTCAITGFVGLELLKLVGKRPFTDFRNITVNLGINIYQMSDPTEATHVDSEVLSASTPNPLLAYPEKFTKWDKLEFRGTPASTFLDMHAWLKSAHGLDVNIVSAQGFKNAIWKAKSKAASFVAIGKQPILSVYNETSTTPLAPNATRLQLTLTDSMRADSAGVLRKTITPVVAFIFG